MSPDPCPCDSDLLAFHLGRLPTDLLERLDGHLTDCPRCETYLQKLEEIGDTMLEALRRGVLSDTPLQLTTTPPATAGTTAPPALPGYEVLGELGRGGMGVVYKAWQTGLNRLVALKMILSRGQASAENLARFRIEAEAIARLQHPNIVQIYEIGEHDRQPYFSLEYCSGGSLNNRLDGRPLPAPVGAALTETLARAVHAAHCAGVVHRDLKPANILLAQNSLTPNPKSPNAPDWDLGIGVGDFSLKVSDFGLAKKLDVDSGQTATGQMMGTPSYMAPEQASGSPKDVGPAADIYALGAILYVFLTGRPPFVAATPLDTVRQVVDDEPAAPTQLNAKTPRDLETICLKCLQKDPKRRYPTAEALADDLRCFLDRRPISARPTPAWEAAWLWAKRRPAVAALTAFSAFVIVVGVGLVTWQWRTAVHNFREAEQRKQEAVANFRLARDAVDQYLMKVAGHPGLRAAGARSLQKELLEAARGFYTRFVTERGDDPTLAVDLVRAHRQLGRITHETGARDVGITHFRQAIALLEPMSAARPDDAVLGRDMVDLLGNLGIGLHDTGQNAEALAIFERGKDLGERLTTNHADDLELRDALRRLYNHLGITHNNGGRREAAIAAHERAKDLGEALVRDQPENREYRSSLAISYNNLGTVRQRMGFEAGRQSEERANILYTAAIQAFERATDIWQELAKDQLKVPEEYQYRLASAATNLGAVQRSMKQPDAAARSFDTARAHLEKLVAVHPDVTDYQTALASNYDNLSLLANTSGKPDESLAWCRKAIPVLEAVRVKEPNNANVAQVLRNASWNEAESLTKLGRHAEALPAWDRAIQAATGVARDELRLLRAQTLARTGDHAGAAAAATGVPSGTVPGFHEFLTAGVYALAMAAVREDTALDTPSRERNAEQYAKQALEVLGRAKEHGYFNRPDRLNRLKTSPDLNPLRERADFQQFLASLTNRPSGSQH